jgi:tetratricopeptide (TPR) repeat protein
MGLYRRILSLCAGQRSNEIYDTRPVAARAIKRLSRLPQDLPGRQEAYFHGYVTEALSWSCLGSVTKAELSLEKARALDPDRADEDTHYLLVKSQIEPHPVATLQILLRVVDLDARFEVAQFYQAVKSEFLWRSRPSLERNVADMVLAQYEEVIKINPGNLGAWANKGYVLWLLGKDDDLQKAQRSFENGREYKIIRSTTYVAELDYGLARIAAERGDFRSAYAHYVSAVSGNLNQLADNPKTGYQEYHFTSLGEESAGRFERYYNKVKKVYDFWLEDWDEPYSSFLRALDAIEQAQSTDDVARGIGEIDKLLKCISCLIIEPDRKEIQTWIRNTANKTRLKRALADGNLLKFSLQLKDVFTNSTKEGGFGDERREGLEILKSSVLSCLIDKYLAGAATKRVRKSVYAFVLNDYGEACFYFYLQTGIKKKREEAKLKFKEASQVNPHYMDPHYNLHLYFDEEPALEEAFELDPRWPQVALDLARARGKSAQEKRNSADELRKAGLENEAREIDAQAGELRREALSFIREAVPHEWVWKQGGKASDPELNWKSLAQTRSLYNNSWAELTTLHVLALYNLGLILSGKPDKKEALELFCFIKQQFWPADFELVRQIRELLREDIIHPPFTTVRGIDGGSTVKEVFMGAYGDLVRHPGYKGLKKHDRSCRQLESGNRLLLLLKREYRNLLRVESCREVLLSDGYPRLLLYQECNEEVRTSIDHSLTQYSDPWWALTLLAEDDAFKEEAEAVLSNATRPLRKKQHILDHIVKENKLKYLLLLVDFPPLHEMERALRCYDATNEVDDPDILFAVANLYKTLQCQEQSRALEERARQRSK